MKLIYIRTIDKYLGLFLCFLLFYFRKILSFFTSFLKSAKPKQAGIPQKILVIKFFGFGSIILAFDLFQVIRANFGQARICALTLEENREIYRMSGIFDEIITLRLSPFPVFFWDTLRALRKLKKASFDVSFDLEFSARFSSLITAMAGAQKRIGFEYPGIWRGDFFTDTLRFREDMKLRASYLELAGFLPVKHNAPPKRIELSIAAQEAKKIDDFFAREGLSGKEFLVGVNVNTSELSLLRRWPREYFKVLIEEMIKKYSAQVIFVGGSRDREYVRQTIELIDFKDHLHDISGLISLSQLAQLFSKLKLFISNDSGPLHLASYLSVPTVSFFGPETPLIYGPEGKKDLVFYKELPCSPCMRVSNYKKCECPSGQRCLKEIGPLEVMEEIERKRIFR